LEILKAENDEVIGITSFYTNDCLFDCAWCEENEFVVASSCGNGNIDIWNIKTGKLVISWQEHNEEASCVDWNRFVCIYLILFLISKY